MKYVILFALFAPIIYLACRQKKWYLYLLFAFVGVLPEQVSIRVYEGIPLLSATRVLILLLLGFWIYDKWKTKKFHFPKSLVAFLAINVIISVVNLRYGMDDIRRIFLLVFERALLVVMVMDMIHDREELLRCIDFSIMGCAALAVIGIVQTVFDYDIASALQLTETITSTHISPRMGLVRAFSTYNAISYGGYCAFMALLILYRLYNTKSIWHSAAFALNFVALICTFSRSAWLCLAAVLLLPLALYRTKLIRRLLPAIAMILALLVLLCCIQPKLFSAFVETGKSSINTLLNAIPDSVISQIFPNMKQGFALDKDFGLNATDPAYSRNAQWTAVQYMAQEGDLLFGYGYNALLHGRIHFFFDRWAAQWQPTTFVDVGLVALIAESGLIGAISYLGLLGYMLVYAFRKRSKEEKFDFYRVVMFIVPFYLLMNILASFLHMEVLWLFIGLFYAYRKLDANHSCDTIEK